MTSEERLISYRQFICDLDTKLDQWLLDHPEEVSPVAQKLLKAAAADIRIPIVEVRENSGFWEVVVDGRMVFGSSGREAWERATKRAAEILKSYE